MTDLSEDADATEALRNAANLAQRMLLVETQTANLNNITVPMTAAISNVLQVREAQKNMHVLHIITERSSHEERLPSISSSSGRSPNG